MLHRPGRVAAATATLLLLLGLPFLGVRFVGVDASVLPEQHCARQVDEALRTSYDRDAASPILVASRHRRPRLPRWRRTASGSRRSPARTTVSAPQQLDGVWRIDV